MAYLNTNEIEKLKELRLVPAIAGIAMVLLFFACSIVLYSAQNTILYSMGLLLHSGALLGMWLICHESAHHTLFKNRRINNFCGHLFSLPIFTPFIPMKFHHTTHHKYTNILKKDLFWYPLYSDKFKNIKTSKKFFYTVLRSGFIFLGTLSLLVAYEYNPKSVSNRIRDKAVRSIVLTSLFLILSSSILFYTLGFKGVLLYLILPQLLYHSIFSSISFLHHTSHLKFENGKRITWSKTKNCNNSKQADISIYLSFPAIFSKILFNIDYHAPHHYAPKIPFYNLPQAQSLMVANGYKVKKINFNFRTLVTTITQCQLIDPESLEFRTFKESKVS